jgi:hypothetical protein
VPRSKVFLTSDSKKNARGKDLGSTRSNTSRQQRHLILEKGKTAARR